MAVASCVDPDRSWFDRLTTNGQEGIRSPFDGLGESGCTSEAPERRSALPDPS